MQVQSLLLLTIFATFFLSFSLPIQYPDRSRHGVKSRLENNAVSFLSHVNSNEECKLNYSELVERQTPPNNSLDHAKLALDETYNKPIPDDVYTMPNTSQFLHALSDPITISDRFCISDKFTGDHVLQAIFNFHLHNFIGHENTLITCGSALTQPRCPLESTTYPHQFYNNGNILKLDSAHLATKPQLYEFPLKGTPDGYHSGIPGAARIVMEHHPPENFSCNLFSLDQYNSDTYTVSAYTFVGVIGHPTGDRKKFVKATKTISSAV